MAQSEGPSMRLRPLQLTQSSFGLLDDQTNGSGAKGTTPGAQVISEEAEHEQSGDEYNNEAFLKHLDTENTQRESTKGASLEQ
jgi:hypothetical protein